MFPKVKKRITSFLLSEEGKVSKQSLLSLGSFLSAAVIGGVLASKEAAAAHTNDLFISYSGDVAVGTHAHHSSATTSTTSTTRDTTSYGSGDWDDCISTTSDCSTTSTTSDCDCGTTACDSTTSCEGDCGTTSCTTSCG